MVINSIRQVGVQRELQLQTGNFEPGIANIIRNTQMMYERVQAARKSPFFQNLLARLIIWIAHCRMSVKHTRGTVLFETHRVMA